MMKAALLSLAVLGIQSATPVSDHVPQLAVEATCKDTTTTDKDMGLSLAQSYEGCMHDEMAAREQLIALWQKTSGPVRNSCEGEATAGGSPSYVDLLTCIQMSDDWVKSQSPAVSLRGASKNRNKN